MKVKIDDVAKKAGVSISTVSRVVNGYEHVSKKSKERVEKAIRELEYSPSQAARSLASQKSKLIGIIVPDLTNQYYANMITAIEEEASKLDYSIIICNIQENMKKELKYMKMLKEMWVDGVILMHEKINDETKKFLMDCSFPVVLSSVKIDDLKLPNININDEQAAFDATNYLLELGHRRVAMISGDLRDITAGISRLKGYKRALTEAGIKIDESLIKEGYFKFEDGYNNMKTLLMLKDRPTAVFAASDVMAIGAMNCAMDMGFEVPEDISFMGFDNIDMASVVRPRLSTVNQPAKLIGQVSFRTLLNKMNDKMIDEEIVIEHSLVKRNSCKEVNFEG
ncbi:LacI family transcriptional regulator [Acidaminobacter sp. JC074]|uniref:LacI family DNA-binding transcriptional regulator n=1 Tax=Acidaminobacter sp. JC074 TaxID=2530199 RepID=UPI001F0FD26A|nr:LacI family DNA-binding transcriptional regulator [Acidaminobacter sp. JC074]MCH4888976.1 LacI family transcriptional regulator [Acidaminobacter sp. JC074]